MGFLYKKRIVIFVPIQKKNDVYIKQIIEYHFRILIQP